MRFTVLLCLAATVASSAGAQSLDLNYIGTIDISGLGFTAVGGMTLDDLDDNLWLADAGPDTNDVIKLDVATGAVLATFDAGVVPGLTLGPDAIASIQGGDLCLFSAFLQDKAGRVNANGTFDTAFVTGHGATAASVDRNQALHIATGLQDGIPSVHRVSTATGAIVSSITLSGVTGRIADMDFDPSSNQLYCLLETQNKIVQVDLVTGATLSETSLPSQLTVPSSPNAGMAFNATGNLLYVSKGSGLEDDRIHVFGRELREAFCFGDGSGTACPCGNAGASDAGCANSFHANGTELRAGGDSLVSQDSLNLHCLALPPNTIALFFQGTARVVEDVQGTDGVVFGDGLRCVGGDVVRIGVEQASAAGIARYPRSGDPSISVRGMIPILGGQRFYQVWYRNAASFCTPSAFNLSNGMKILWAP